MEVDGKKLYLRLLKHVAPYWRVFSLGLLAMVVLALTEPGLPALMKYTMDSIEDGLGQIHVLALLVLVLFLVRGVSSYFTALCMAWVSARVVMDLRAKMVDKLVSLPTSFYHDHPSGALISKVTYDANQVTEAATYVITVLVRDSLSLIFLFGWMCYLDWQLTLIAIACVPVVMVVVAYFARRLRKMSFHLQRTMGTVTHVVQEVIEGERVVRGFGAEEYEKARFAESNNWARRYQVKFASAAALNAPIAQFITSIALAIILYRAAHLFNVGELTMGGFMSFFTAMAMLFSPLKRLTGINGRLQKGIAAAASVFMLIDEASEPDTGTRTIAHARGELELRNVNFAYAGGRGPAITDFSLHVHPGETVALVGPSGSGKSTLANLIPRFYPVEHGEILLDGVDINELTLKSLRANLALVSQEIVLFNGTVRDNIAYGPLTGAPEQDIVQAGESAYAMEFINELPQGLDTPVGESAVRLSGGQRQRLAIARAFLKGAPVLILDEATSALDNASERHVQSALAKLREGRTTIIIAHRLSTIENADRIVVMEQGRIVDIGTHQQLLERNSLYAGLYRFQFSRDGGEIEPSELDEHRLR